MSIFETPTAEAVIPTGPGELPLVAAAPAGSVAQPAVRLSPLGIRLEMLRLERGLSKQDLARSAGTSRQQLWRVMTGKSDLTSSLSFRLATVLDVDSRTLSTSSLGRRAQATRSMPPHPGAYLASEGPLRRTLATLPRGPEGIALKCAVLDAARALAAHVSSPHHAWLDTLRSRVESGEL